MFIDLLVGVDVFFTFWFIGRFTGRWDVRGGRMVWVIGLKTMSLFTVEGMNGRII